MQTIDEVRSDADFSAIVESTRGAELGETDAIVATARTIRRQVRTIPSAPNLKNQHASELTFKMEEI